jgi:ATP-binding cassette subfamily B multidrug efflux pump
VMHRGEIREVGSHSELMQKQGIYFRLYQLQYEKEEPRLAHSDSGVKQEA